MTVIKKRDQQGTLSLMGSDNEELNKEEKLYRRIFKPFWVDYPAANKGLKHLHLLLKQPRSHRPQCGLIVGDPAAGKTTMARQFLRINNLQPASTDKAIKIPIVYVQSPPKADSAGLFTNILRTIGAPFRPSWQIPRKQDQVLQMLTRLETRMLIIDEFHAMLAGHYGDRSTYMNVLKFLSNELEIPIIGIGTNDVNLAMQTDQQFGNRFEPFVLSPFQPDKSYVKFMVQVCKHANFHDIDILQDRTFVHRVHAMTAGSVGETWKLICRLVYHAETEGKGKLKIEMLEKIDWVMPMMRKKLGSV